MTQPALTVALVSAAPDPGILEPLLQANEFIQAWRHRGCLRKINVHFAGHVPAEQLATSNVWAADVVILDGHGYWPAAETISLGGASDDASNRPWTDVLPDPLPPHVRALVLGACSSGEAPVRDAIRSQASNPIAVLGSRVIAQEWHGLLLYPSVLVRLATAHSLRTAEDYAWALEPALQDATHLWIRKHTQNRSCRRHHNVALAKWPCGDPLADAAVQRATQQAAQQERKTGNDLGAWRPEVILPLATERAW